MRAIVIGATGYSGVELVRLLSGHGEVELVGRFDSGRHDGPSEPRARRQARGDLPPLRPFDLAALPDLAPDVAFLAAPHELSLALASALLDLGVVVFDLSGAFRLRSPAAYPRYYGFEHDRPDLLARAAYGLPERHRREIASADLVAVPGCYPTAITLAVAPLVDGGAIDAGGDVVINAVSGVSGAGKAPTQRTHFCSVSLQPYGVHEHRHRPEIEQACGCRVVFTPHLGPFARGILATIHARPAAGWDDERVRKLLADAYQTEAFVHVHEHGHWPAVADVRGTNHCDVACSVSADGRDLIVVSAIDNLLKGAAGQAVQCLNARFGLPETLGLERGVECSMA